MLHYILWIFTLINRLGENRSTTILVAFSHASWNLGLRIALRLGPRFVLRVAALTHRWGGVYLMFAHISSLSVNRGDGWVHLTIEKSFS